uniref:Molydopterin dinucleotide-binding region n=1 Tax=Caulobacter sp. (strain K31) TaxID=366602 RepID=B0T0J5_CAUSK
MSPPTSMVRTGVCPLCEAMCGLEMTVDGDRVVGVRGDASDPLSAGFLCPKAVALEDLSADPRRIDQPMLRTGDQRRPIPWDEALDLAGTRLGDLQRRHGVDAVAFYSGNPNLHSYAAQLSELTFKRALRSRNCSSTASVDHLPHMVAAAAMFGHPLLLPVPDLDRTDFFLVLGANPADSNGSLMGAPGMPLRLHKLRQRGTRVVVVDPCRTRTADLADTHLFIRPGTDALLLLALVRILLTENLVRLGRLSGLVDAVEALRQASAPFSPDRIAPVTGLDPRAVVDLARDLAAAPTSVVYGRVGVCTQEHGALCAWLINVLNILTGNLDRPGGAMFPTPAVDIVAAASMLGAAGGMEPGRSRVRGLPGFNGELPLSTLAEEIDTPGEGQVRGLIVSAGNPVLSGPNGRRLEAALPRLDFMVAIDRYVTETTRHADLILPAAMPLERDHYDVVFRAFGVRDTARFQEAILPRPPGVREDWRIYCGLGERIARRRGLEGHLSALSLSALQAVTPRRILDLLLRLGPHGLSLNQLARSPHAVDLGPLRPALPARLRTPDKRIQLTPPVLLEALPGLAARLDMPQPPSDALVLIGRRQLRSNNSWMHHLPRLQRGSNRCTLLIHETDARRRGLAPGQTVEIRGRTGAVEAPVEITNRIMPGVVSLPHGFGHGRIAAERAIPRDWIGASLNDLTDDTRLDRQSGAAAFSGVPVEVAAVPRELAEASSSMLHPAPSQT